MAIPFESEIEVNGNKVWHEGDFDPDDKANTGTGSNAWSAATAIAPVLDNDLGVVVGETLNSAQYWISENRVMTLAVDMTYSFSADPPTLTADFVGIDVTLPESKSFADAIGGGIRLGNGQSAINAGVGSVGEAYFQNTTTLRIVGTTYEVTDGDSVRIRGHASFLLDW